MCAEDLPCDLAGPVWESMDQAHEGRLRDEILQVFFLQENPTSCGSWMVWR